MQGYLTLKTEGTDAFTEKKSRFIGAAAPVQNQEQALAFLQRIRKQHWDARHHVFAYVLRTGEQHCSDDGEPQGTGGVPTLQVLQKAGITDAVVVVTRYFGGVLLGAGGLLRAYSHGASLAVSAAGVVRMRPGLQMELHCSYRQFDRLSVLLHQFGADQTEPQFTQAVTVRFRLSPERLGALQDALAEASAGTVAAKEIGTCFFEEPVPFPENRQGG